MITKKNTTIGFWRRFGAQWIDVFVIYSITKFVIALLSIVDLRISLEFLFIIIAAIYSSILLFLQKQTVGKMLLQIRIISKNNESMNLRNILLREVFGKWGITILLPLMIGRLWIGDSWIPTVYDIFLLTPIVLLCISYYLVTKQMWYEQMAGLSVKRILITSKVKVGFYALMATAVLGITAIATEYIMIGRWPSRLAAFQNNDSTKPYVKFIDEQNTGPVDYIIGLFDKYDVVVLCERAHPEMTQYDFIYDLISDPRFIRKSGHIFTEIGQVGMQNYLNEFMMTDSLGETEVHNRAIHILRNVAVGAGWTKFNMYKYIERLYHLNQKLLPENRIQHHFTDSKLDWASINSIDEYDKHKKKYIWNRDEIMAETVIKKMRHLSKTTNKQAKALVIMNYRHGMDLTDRLPNVKRKNTYEFLKDSFGNRSANVLINSRILLTVPVAGGVWDAAFEKTSNKPIGIDFQGSPFGNSYFDMFPFNSLLRPFDSSNIPSSNGSLRYRDVFTGFVFTHPIKEHSLKMNIPNYYDGFEDEYIRRMACMGMELPKGIDLNITSPIQEYLFSGNIPFDFKVETGIELFVYFLVDIGLLIGLASFLFRPKNTIALDID